MIEISDYKQGLNIKKKISWAKNYLGSKIIPFGVKL